MHISICKQTSKNTHHIYKAADVRIHVEIHETFYSESILNHRLKTKDQTIFYIYYKKGVQPKAMHKLYLSLEVIRQLEHAFFLYLNLCVNLPSGTKLYT